MARTAITVTDLTSAIDVSTTSGLTALPTGTAVDPTNGHSIANAFKGNGKLLLYVDHTTGSTKTFTLKAGANPPALRKNLGDIVFSLSASTKYYIGPIEAAHFAQSDGSLNIDLQASITGTIYAVRLPRDV